MTATVLSMFAAVMLMQDGLAVRSSAWLGVWCVIFIAWCVVLVLWVRAILKYNKSYRKYEQAHREYQQANCQPSEELRLAQQSLGQFHQRHGMILKSLRRLGLIVGYTNLQGRPRDTKDQKNEP